MNAISSEQLVYVDESGIDGREQYAYRHARRGDPLHEMKCGERGECINMIAAWCDRLLFAPFTVTSSCDRNIFEVWLEQILVPELKPGQTVVMDNATFHKGRRIESLIQETGCDLWYFPPYSPDLNKIEHCWSWLKRRIVQCLSDFKSSIEAVESVLKLAS